MVRVQEEYPGAGWGFDDNGNVVVTSELSYLRCFSPITRKQQRAYMQDVHNRDRYALTRIVDGDEDLLSPKCPCHGTNSK